MNEQNENKPSKIASVAAGTLASVLFICATVCVCALAIAFTIAIIDLLF